LAVYYAVHPEVLGMEAQKIAVITDGYARGLTLNVDAYNKAYMNPACRELDGLHGVTVAKGIDAKAFINTFINIFR
jgi:inosine-uridine nucleoside N-ribohydrolase